MARFLRSQLAIILAFGAMLLALDTGRSIFGTSSTELITCLEMARDARRIHSDADASSAVGPGTRPAPMGHRQPTRQ